MSDAEAGTGQDAKAKTKKNPFDMVLRVVLCTGGFLLLLGFFLPWVTIGTVANISGLELVIGDNLPHWQRVVLGFCPVMALALGLAGFLGFRGARWVGVVSGALVLGYALFTIAYLLFHMIDIGLWMVLFGALMTLIAGSFASLRALAMRSVARARQGSSTHADEAA